MNTVVLESISTPPCHDIDDPGKIACE